MFSVLWWIFLAGRDVPVQNMNVWGKPCAGYSVWRSHTHRLLGSSRNHIPYSQTCKHANMDFMKKPTWERGPSICQSPDRRGNNNKEVIALILPQLVILLTASSPLILILRFPSLLQELLLLRITSSA